MKALASVSILLCLSVFAFCPSAKLRQNEPRASGAVSRDVPKAEPQVGVRTGLAVVSTPKTESAKGTSQPTSSTEQVPVSLQIWKTRAEILAYVFAFLFFLFKAHVGYFTTSLSVGLTCKRSPIPKRDDEPENDNLAVIMTLEKGDNGTVRLVQVEVRVSGLDSEWVQKEPLELRRLDYDRRAVLQGEKDAIHWDRAKARWRFMQFPPGDSSQFAWHFRVPSGEACQVEVVLMGKGRWPKIRTSQWRASDISLPDSN